ncbi:MAG: hypothetical protein ACD_75C02011G0002 [uncultured bacterium]|nr:MAG: hypothetical protein ACD_75C02011G0002 [uncultured bacterium]
MQHSERPAQRGQGKDEIDTVGQPRQPAGDKMVALAIGQPALVSSTQRFAMVAHDLNRPVGPAIALFLEVDEGIRHDPLAV